MRFGRPDADRLSFNAAISYARWADIQADLIDARGLPFTTNLGNGRIYGLEVEASWRATPALSFDASAFINHSALSAPDPAFAAADERALPNIARAGARAAGHFRTALSPRLTLALDGSVRYVGESHLGIGAPLDIDQGRFVDGQIGAASISAVSACRSTSTMSPTRAAIASRSATRSPSPARQQTTPLRPRTVRIGFDAQF